MARKPIEAIAFPANPFVAFADFLLVLVLILIVAYLAQSITSSSLAQRAAVASLQKDINVHLHDGLMSSGGFPADAFQEVYVDGDLQRFQLRGDLAFEAGSWELKPAAKTILKQFALQIVRYQKSPRPFKRITLLGHADASEGDTRRCWNLSVERARTALNYLQDNTQIDTGMLEVSGIGKNELAVKPGDRSRSEFASANRRLDVIVIYSGDRAWSYQLNARPSGDR